MDPAAFIAQLPKTELHLHIEGTFEPELMFAMAARNQVKVPFASVAEVKQAYKFSHLQSFLDIYYQACQVLIHEQDFYELTWEYLTRVAKENVQHVEIFFDPQSHTDRGIEFATVIKGMKRAQDEALTKYGITSRLIMCFLRHLSADRAMQTLEQALPHKQWLTAVGLDSSERGFPPELFVKVFDRARAEGLLTVAHAGEEGPPDYMWQALNLLKVSRIDHGIACTQDEKLMDYLAATRVPLTVCPLSNLKLCVVKSLSEHPLKKLLDRGICVTVNSDDPAYFGGYVSQNYLETQKALALSLDDLAALARNGIEATFLDAASKQKLQAKLDELVALSPRH